jgi:hypothetical protein
MFAMTSFHNRTLTFYSGPESLLEATKYRAAL